MMKESDDPPRTWDRGRGQFPVDDRLIVRFEEERIDLWTPPGFWGDPRASKRSCDAEQ
jgi:hypothetical protein